MMLEICSIFITSRVDEDVADKASSMPGVVQHIFWA